MTLIRLPVFCFFFLITESLLSQDIGDISKQKPVTIHGDIGLDLMAYTVSGIPSRQMPFSFLLSANATINLYGIEIPFSFVFSDRQRSYAQSFNEFGISPRYKWITLHAGYRNITFSNFTLAGHTFLGGGIELNPGLFRFGFIYGQFQRKTSGSSVFESDPLPQYTRTGFAVKLGVGTKNNFFDLLFLRIRDDTNSLHQPDTGAIRTPEQNIVAGINSHFTFFKKLILEVEGAVSLYTTNMRANPSLDNTTPSILRRMNKFLLINQSSEYYTALRSSLQYKAKLWSLKLEYKHIDPNYRSMGAYFFNNDLENLTITPYFTLFKRKLMLNGSMGLQRDNLKGSKLATSTRNIWNANISFCPSSKFGIDANYNNYSIQQKAGREPLNDSTKVNQTIRNFSIMPRLLFMRTKLSHMINLIYTLSDFNDKNKYTSGLTEYRSQTAQLHYLLGLIKNKLSFSFGLTWTSLSNPNTNNTGIGGTFSISKSCLKDKLTLNWNNSITQQVYQQEESWVYNSNLITSYKVQKHQSLRLNIYFTGNYYNPGSINPSFNEIKGDLSYVFTF